MGTVSDLIAEVQSAGFDVTPTEALTVLDRRHKEMCARARWHRMTRQLTPAAGPTAYTQVDLPLDLVELFSVTASTGGEVGLYTRTSNIDRGALATGELVVSGRGGVFVEGAPVSSVDTTPETSIFLSPPVDDSSQVTVEGAFEPPALTTAETSGAFVRVPVDAHEGLLAGVYASLVNRPGEARPDLAAGYEAMFVGKCQELRQRADRRYRARGPRQIRLVGQTI